MTGSLRNHSTGSVSPSRSALPFSTPHLSRTWQGRLSWAGAQSRRAGAILVTLCAVFGAMAGCKVFFAPDRPDIAGIAQRVGNQQALVGAFASDFVTAVLTTTPRQRHLLQRFITLPPTPPATDPANTIEPPQAAIVSSAEPVSVILAGGGDTMALYSVTVVATERAYASADPVRSFYQVPVSTWNYQPRAMSFPARVNGPGPGADFKTAYRQAVSTDSPLFAVVRDFARAYLVDGSGLDRYVMKGTPLVAVGGYQSAIVTSAVASGRIPNDPKPGAQLDVLVNVTAQTSQFANVDLVYPLTLESNAGTWMVAAIGLIPEIGESEPDPLQEK